MPSGSNAPLPVASLTRRHAEQHDGADARRRRARRPPCAGSPGCAGRRPGSDTIGCGSVTSSRTNSGATRSLVRTDVSATRSRRAGVRRSRRGRSIGNGAGHRRHGRARARSVDDGVVVGRRRRRASTPRPRRRAASAVTGPMATTTGGVGGAECLDPARRRRAAGEHHGVDGAQPLDLVGVGAPHDRAVGDDRLDVVTGGGQPVGEHRAAPGRPGRRARGPAPAGTRRAAPRPGRAPARGRPAARHPRPARPPSPGRRRRGAPTDAPAAAGTHADGAVRRRDDEPVERRRAGPAPGAGDPPSAASAISISGTCTTVAPERVEPSGERARLGAGQGDAPPAITPDRRRAPPRRGIERRRGPSVERAGRSRPRATPPRRRRGTCAACRPRRGRRRAASSRSRARRGSALDLDGVAGRGVVDGGEQLERVASSSPRHSTATQPCPTAGTNAVGVEALGDAVGQPEHLERGDGHHDRPAVGDPCRGGWRCCRAARRTARSGRAAASWARRRTEPVATVAPVGEVGERPADRARRRRRAGAGRRRCVSAGWATDGRSLAECTATSARPSSTACCTSLTNTPWPPMACSGTSWRRSPVVSTNTSSTVARRSPRRSASATRLRPGCVPAGCRGWPARTVGTPVSDRSNRSLHGRRVALALAACRRRRAGAPTARAAAWRRSPWSAPRRRRARASSSAARRPAKRASSPARTDSARSWSWATSGAACRAVDLDGELLDLLGDDRAHAVGLGGAQLEPAVGPVAQVVEIEQRDAVELGRRTRSTSRGTAMSTMSSGRPGRMVGVDVVAGDDALARRRAGDDHVARRRAPRRARSRPTRPAADLAGEPAAALRACGCRR